jgi:hypothetical protein
VGSNRVFGWDYANYIASMNFPFQKVLSGDHRRESKGIIHTARISLFREEIARFSVTITELPGKIGVSNITLIRENTQKSSAILCHSMFCDCGEAKFKASEAR